MEKKGRGLVLATAVISGFSIFLSKFGVSGMAPTLFTTGKNVIVAALLVATLLALGEWRLLRTLTARQWLQLALIGLIGGSLPFLLFFTGLSLTSAAQAGMLHKTLFVWVTLLAALLLKERVGWHTVAGGALLLAGNAVLLQLTGFSFGAGDVLVLTATLLWAVEITLGKRFLSAYALPGRVVAFGRMGFGSLFLVLYLFGTGALGTVVALTGAQVGWILVTSVLLYGYVFTFYEGLARIPASAATAVLLLGTVITTLLSLFWTGSIAATNLLGSLLLLTGALLFLGAHTALPSPRRAGQ